MNATLDKPDSQLPTPESRLTHPAVIRQGDLLFVPRPTAPDREHGMKPVSDGILARGEATGHAHRLQELESAEILVNWRGEMTVLAGPQGATVVHDEHGPVRLEPSTVYTVHRAREYDYRAEMPRLVRD